MAKIEKISCHKIVNSRAQWTIETHVTLNNGAVGIQTVPEGASKGTRESIYVSPDAAVTLIENEIATLLKGVDVADQLKIDHKMLEYDGTPNKSKLGGNSILSVSLASAKAAAQSQGINLYEHLFSLQTVSNTMGFPTPVFNILNGGKHAKNDLSFQEFMVIPSRSMNIQHAIEAGITVYKQLEEELIKNGLSTGVGDEGGFAPSGLTVRKALDLIKKVANQSYKVGESIFLGSDVASDSFRNELDYDIREESLHLSQAELQAYYLNLLNDYELIYLEDPFYETHYSAWQSLYEKVSSRLMLVADDLTVTNPTRLKQLIPDKLANAVIVKPNQVGTLSETLDFMKTAKDAGMSLIVSHRSGDTAEDTFIADLAYATNADFMKAGAPARGERVVKYNRLLEIFEQV